MLPPEIFIILVWRSKHTVFYPSTWKIRIKLRPYRAQSKNGSRKYQADIAERDYGKWGGKASCWRHCTPEEGTEGAHAALESTTMRRGSKVALSTLFPVPASMSCIRSRGPVSPSLNCHVRQGRAHESAWSSLHRPSCGFHSLILFF